MTQDQMLDRVRRWTGRRRSAVALPPAVHEPTARRVYSDLGLPDLFVHAARRGGMTADLVHVEQVTAAVADHLRQSGVSRVCLTPTPILRKIRLAESLADGGFTLTAEGAAESIVTGCPTAVAETGTLAFPGAVPTGWSGVAVRVAVLEPKNFVPDLVDLFSTLSGDVVLVAGPVVRTFVLH